MKIIFNLIAITILLSACNQSDSQNPSTINEFNEVQEPIKITSPSTTENSFREINSLVKYNDFISFGMTISNWNRNLAIQTKEGKFDGINEEFPLNNYTAFRRPTFENSSKYILKGGFISPVTKLGYNKYEIIRIEGVNQSEQLLSEIHFIYEKISIRALNRIVRDFIKMNNLEFLLGNEFEEVTRKPPSGQEIYYSITNDFKKSVAEMPGGLQIANTTVKDLFECGSNSVFENAQSYVLIDISEKRNNEIKRDSNGDIISITEDSIELEVEFTVFSKEYSNVDINQYMTPEQKDPEKYKSTTDKLIEKALK